jgi:hypothetical protein
MLVSLIDALENFIQFLLDVKFGFANATNSTAIILAINSNWEWKTFFNAFTASPVSAEMAHFNLSLLLASTTCGDILPTAETVRQILWS